MMYVLLIFLIHCFSVTVLKTLKFKSFVIFGTHTLLDRSLRVLQLPMHLYELTADG